MSELFRRRRLPHWDKPGSIYFVTTCLDGSIPALGLKDLSQYRARLNSQQIPTDLTDREWETRKWKLLFARSEQWLDIKSVVRHLADGTLALEVENSLLHFAGERYTLWAWVVMPSHFHWLFEPMRDWTQTLSDLDRRSPRERIMHSVKRFSSSQCNQIRHQSGAFWQEESYDHCVDDLDELNRIIEYIERNPVKAGLVKSSTEYRFSSEFYRLKHGIPFGRPLIGKSDL